MSEQPEALRLAALWEKQSHGYALTPEAETAAELRRLHALNGELLEALKELEYSSDGYIKRYPEESEVNAVIKKAEGDV
jgi:hypothetical protein